MNKTQKINCLVEKYNGLIVLNPNEDKKRKELKRILLHISKEAYNLGIQSIQESHVEKDNHKIGIELESYCNVLECRGFNDESKILLDIASKVK